MTMQSSHYSLLDRAVHRLAFGTSFAQQILCDLETRLYGEQIARQPVDHPAFITALPRAGTTLLLEVLSKHPDVVTHTYRDMPFVMSPVIWGRMSGKFQVDLAKRERSHSDGMLVNADSPEAFEEVLWLRQTPEALNHGGVALCPHETAKAIRAPLSDMIRRLIASRALDGPGTPRYVSKNNANIARIPALRNAFPDAHILVPMRAPLDHAMSLHRQHMRYLDIHAQSRFTKAYMKDIGHFEFGALHRPILFDGMEQVISQHDPRSLDYWIGYWICAYRHLTGQADITFLDMERFTATGDLAPVLAVLGLGEDATTIEAARSMVRPIRRYDPPEGVSASLLDDAMALSEEIRTTRT